MVTAHHYAVGLEDGGPAGGLEGLGGFVDEKSGEVAPLHEAVGAANEGAAHYAGFIEKVCVNLDFQFHLSTAEAVGTLAFGSGSKFLADVPQFVVVGM